MSSAPRPAKPRAARSNAPARTASAREGGRAVPAAPFDPFSAVAAFIFRVESVGLVLIVLALALFIVTFSGRALFAPVGAPFARTLGLGAAMVAPALAGLGALIFLHRLHVTRAALRAVAGWGMAVAVLWGMLGWLTPDWRLAGVPLTDVTLGGDVGRFLGRTLPGLTLWAASLAGASVLVWPGLTRRALHLLPPAGRTIWGWHLPERAFHIAVEGFRALLRPGMGDSWQPAATAHGEDAPSEPNAAAVASPAPAADTAAPVFARRGTGTALMADPAPPADDAEAAHARPSPGAWPRPPRDLLTAAPAPEISARDNEARGRLIVETLAGFGVDARIVSISQGPTITQFGLEPGWVVKTRTIVEKDATGRTIFERDGSPKTRTEELSRTRVRVSEITRLTNDLALALAAPSIRIEAPVPGKPVVGIEVPNTHSAVVTLRQVIETPSFQKLSARSRLALALGQGVSGEVVVADLAKMPHLLIAGATGSGKSVCINSIIASILMHASPNEVRFVLVDPKRVELTGYEPIPHLALSKVIVDMEDVVGTLGAVIHEMDARYKLFAALGVRNLEAYNKHGSVTERLPQWVVVIDELADLMMAAPVEVEKQICRLAQLARATGIHLVIATQRPSVDVITGLIKANFPTRIAFAVTSQVDSRTILDTGGAEKLLGRGDMLYQAPDAAKPRRIQGVFVSDQEIERLVGFWANEKYAALRPPTYDHLLEQAKAEAEEDEDMDEDPLLERARELAAEHSRISTSMLQRRLRIGYPRAARLMDALESEGVVGAAEGGGSREVFGDGF